MRALLCAFVLLLSAPAFAEKWALLIGINDYEDRNFIASLGAADNDARKLKEVLKSKMGFPEANIEMLVSDGDNKPTRSNIILALGKLRENAKAGDTVFVFYSGHGTEMNGVTYLLPHDFRGRNQFTGTETALAISTFKGLLSQVKAKALIMAWDMCRNDPFAKGKSGDAARSKLGSTKTWKVVPLVTRSTDPPVVVTFFACSPGESSFEWQDKNRGYFAWFLEEGMKGAAADSSGNITLGGLARYVRTNVVAKTRATEPAVQSPTSEMTGAAPEDYVLLGTGKPVAKVQPVPVSIKPVSTPGTKPTVPVSQGKGTGAVDSILQKIRLTHLANRLATLTRPLQFNGQGEAILLSQRGSVESYNGVLNATNNHFRIEYIDWNTKKKIVVGLSGDGGNAWKTEGGSPVTTVQDERFYSNPVGPLFYVLLSKEITLSEQFSKPKDATPYLSASDPTLGDFKILYNPQTFVITEISLKRSGIRPVFKYSNWKVVEGIPLPHRMIEDIPGGNVTFDYHRITPTGAYGEEYFVRPR